jgi:hypothetical protein
MGLHLLINMDKEALLPAHFNLEPRSVTYIYVYMYLFVAFIYRSRQLGCCFFQQAQQDIGIALNQAWNTFKIYYKNPW